MTELLQPEALAADLRREMAARVAQMGFAPQLVTVMVGEDPASRAYVARKHQDCAEVGLRSREVILPADISARDLSAVIKGLNEDADVHGFLVQLPLPDHLDGAVHLAEISPAKDIDGLHPVNLGALLAGQRGVLPCTPAAILTLLRRAGVEIMGQEVVIVGRGALVGRPLAMLLSAPEVGATVTLAHRQTPDLAGVVARGDIVISAAGQPDLIRGDMIKAGAVVVGIGISYDAEGRMVSDIAEDVAGIARLMTPPHGGVGALTRAMLLANLISLAARP